MKNAQGTVLLVAAVLMLTVPVAGGIQVPGPVGIGAPYVLAPPSFSGEQGQHMVAHVRVDDPDFHPTSVVTVETPEDELVLFVFVRGNRFRVSNGPDGDGGFEHVRLDEAVASSSWHRIDVVLGGATATVTIDQRHVVTVDTFTSATVGQLGEDPTSLLPPPYEAVERVGVRWDDGDGSTEHAFTTSPQDRGWIVVDAEGGQVDARADLQGVHSPGGVYIDMGSIVAQDALAQGPAHVSHLLPTGTTRYLAEVAYRVTTGFVYPTGQTILAAVTGDPMEPEVHWAVEIARAACEPDGLVPLGWRLELLGPDGSRTPVTPVYTSDDARHLRVIVDSELDVLEIVVDRADRALRFQGLGLAAPQGRIAFGDLNGALDPEQGSDVVLTAYVDDGRLHVSDGTGEDGEPRDHMIVDELSVGSSWHCYDVVLHGDTYTLHVDQWRSVTARTSVEAPRAGGSRTRSRLAPRPTAAQPHGPVTAWATAPWPTTPRSRGTSAGGRPSRRTTASGSAAA